MEEIRIELIPFDFQSNVHTMYTILPCFFADSLGLEPKQQESKSCMLTKLHHESNLKVPSLGLDFLSFIIYHSSFIFCGSNWIRTNSAIKQQFYRLLQLSNVGELPFEKLFVSSL